MHNLFRRGWWTFSFIIIIFSCQIESAKAVSNKPLSLTLSEVETYAIKDRFAFYEDKSGKLGIEDILNLDRAGQFNRAGLSDLMQSNISSIYWLRFDLINFSGQDSWFIRPANPYLDSTVFEVIEGQILPIQSSKQTKSQRFDSAEIKLPGGVATRIYVRTNAPYVLDLRLELLPQGLYHQGEQLELIFVSILCGVFLALIVYNLFLYVSLRELGYLYYLLFAIINCHLSLMTIRFPENILNLWGIDWLEFIFSYRCLAPLTVGIFARSVLRTKEQHPKLDRVIIGYMIGLVFMMVTFQLAGQWESAWIAFQDSYFLLGAVLYIYAGVFCLWRGFRPALYFLLGMGTFVGGTFVYLAAGQGLIDASPWTLYGSVTGQAAQLLLMSLALADKIRHIDRERLRFALTSEFKSRLLRLISHDIANPLTVIKGTGHTLVADPSAKLQMDRVLRSADKIHEIMRFVLKTEILDDETQIELAPVPLREVFDDLLFLFEARAKEKGITLEQKLADPSMSVIAEKTSLTNEVLGNLLSNAIKFSNSGGHILIRADRRPGDNTIVITVEDQGIGMSKKIIEKLFQNKQTTSRRGTGGETGYGYGISLVQAYMRAYNGQLLVKSWSEEDGAEKTGTAWQVILPTVAKPQVVLKFGWVKMWKRRRILSRQPIVTSQDR